MPTHPKSDILEMALDFAQDLHEVGAMKKVTLREIEELAVPKVRSFTAHEVRSIRERTRLSQPVFARLLNVGTSTVSQWEQGKKKPGGSAARLLDIVERKGVDALT